MLQATLPMSVPPPSPIRPPTNSRDAEPVQQPALQQPALQQPAPGIALAAADSSTTKPTASLQMLLVVMAAALALAGITVSLVFRLGRIRARRAMQPSTACDVGFSQNQASSATTVRHRRHGQHRRPFSATDAFDAPDAVSAADVPSRGSPDAACRGCAPATPARGASAPARRAGAAGYRHAGPARPQRAATETGNGGSRYFSSWRCRLRTNSVRPVRRSRLSRSALRIDCTSANASSTFWLTTI